VRSTENLRQHIHAPDRSGNSETLAGALFDTQNLSMAANPAFLAGGQLGRQDENQFYVRALSHAGVDIEEYATRAQVAGLGAQLRLTRRAPYADGQLGNDSLARTAIDLVIQNLLMNNSGINNSGIRS